MYNQNQSQGLYSQYGPPQGQPLSQSQNNPQQPSYGQQQPPYGQQQPPYGQQQPPYGQQLDNNNHHMDNNHLILGEIILEYKLFQEEMVLMKKNIKI